MRISSFGRKRARLNRFGREQHGVITVEFVIWIPVFLVIMGFIADATIALSDAGGHVECCPRHHPPHDDGPVERTSG